MEIKADITPAEKTFLEEDDQAKYDEKGEYTVSSAPQLDSLSHGEETEVKKGVRFVRGILISRDLQVFGDDLENIEGKLASMSNEHALAVGRIDSLL